MTAPSDLHLVIFIILAAFTLIIFFLYNRSSAKRIDTLMKQVKEAEDLAFSGTGDGRVLPIPEDLGNKIELNDISFGNQTKSVKAVVMDGAAPSVNNLFKLYTDQISKYQEQTQSRAMSSFVFAIIAMFAGIIFIFWGASYILTDKSWEGTVAGSAISTIGGAISAYITKTFLNIHKLSIQQLNRYFQQPVINDHIVMAQRLADALPNEDARQKAYEKIIDSVALLIKNDSEEATPAAEENDA